MKKWVIALLIVVSIVFVGCSANDDMGSLSEYDMVFLNEKNCGDFL